MVDITVDLVLAFVSAIAVFIMIISILFNRISYFKPFQTYFLIIYVGFLPFLAREAVLAFGTADWIAFFATRLFATAASVIAAVWGHLVTRLYLYPDRYNVRDVFSFSRKKEKILYQIYLIPMVSLVVATWLSYFQIGGLGQPFMIQEAVYPLEGFMRLASVEVEPWFLTLAALVVVAFITYPNYVLYRLRSQLRDKEVRTALRTFAIGFGTVSIILFAVNTIAAVHVSLFGIGNLVNVILLSMVVQAFRKSSFLKAFLGVVPSFVASGPLREDQTVIFYKTGAEKYGPFSRFIIEGTNKGQLVVYFYQGDESTIIDPLGQNGLDVNLHILKGNLRTLPITTLYRQTRTSDERTILSVVRSLETEARSLGREGLRILLDYGEFARWPMSKLVQHLSDPDWTRPDHFVNVMMAFDKQAINNPEVLADLKSKLQLLDLSDTPEVFSRTLGYTHSQISGKKILLEFDPNADMPDVEKLLSALLAEGASNLERTVVFSRTDGPARSLGKGNEPGLKMFLLTTRVSKPTFEKENLVMLPTYDSSLILDSLDKTIQAYSGIPFTVIFDSITHIVFTLGQERSYGLVRQALELMASDRITAVFLLNVRAHQTKTLNLFEDLFDLEMSKQPGARIFEIRKKVGSSTMD